MLKFGRYFGIDHHWGKMNLLNLFKEPYTTLFLLFLSILIDNNIRSCVITLAFHFIHYVFLTYIIIATYFDFALTY